MKRENYELYKWYPLTDDEYWVDDNCFYNVINRNAKHICINLPIL